MSVFLGKRPEPQSSNGVPEAGGQQFDLDIGRRLVAATQAQATDQQIITEEDVRKAMKTLTQYRDAKANLTARLLEDEKWWELRHWEVIRKQQDPNAPEPSSAWLFNSVCAKHADAMDNYPEGHVLPREQSDEGEAKKLSSILPCIMELCEFEKTYSDEWWEKLKHGTAAYFIGWNNDLENGLGDIEISDMDLLNCYWEPGISDIQDSRNFFTVALQDRDILEEQYPQYKGRFTSALANDFKYTYDPNVKLEDKALVVDWYYKVKDLSGRTLLHYVKFAGDACILYASENDPECRDTGYYQHGLFPFDFDPLYPEKGTPVGFGTIAITKSPQLYIDKLGGNILEHSYLGTKTRYFASDAVGVNEDELKDSSQVLVHVESSDLDDKRLKPITVPPLETNYLNVLQMKIDELKETSANRDFSNGGTSSGVTAASAIAALQEAGNKISRDMIQASYRSYKRICSMVIELIRQFYTETREFRITGEDGSTQFTDFSNAGIQEQVLQAAADGTAQLVRKPVFDLKIKAQKRSPFSIEAQYERAKELYGMGFFDPAKAQESMIALEMMDFDGKDKVLQQVQQGQTLYNMVLQLTQQLAMLTGAQMGAPAGPGQGGQNTGGGNGQTISQGRQNATQAAMQPMAQKMAARANPTMNGQNGVRAQ